MARIRSIHPGLASDEAYMTMSMAAKAAWPLLWTECDDGGVFEWKPIVLKARIFPADSVDFAALLSELEALNCVRRVEIGGRDYGLVRNFCRYQRPKKPNYRVALSGEFRTYVGLTQPGTEPDGPDGSRVPDQFPTGGEKSPQMEDGGGRREEEGEKEPHLPAQRPSLAHVHAPEAGAKFDYGALETALRDAAGLENDPSPSLMVLSPIIGLLKGGFSLDEDILPSIRARSTSATGRRPSSWGYFVNPIREDRQRRIDAEAAGAVPIPVNARASPRSGGVDLLEAARKGSERAARRMEAGK